MSELFSKSYKKLETWMFNAKYSGYDLYDGLNSPYFSNLPNTKYIRLPLIRLSADSPINLRPLLKIRPSVGNKSLSLISRAYLRHYHATQETQSLKKGRKVLAKLIKSSLIKKYGNHSWHAHSYGFQLKNIYYSKESKPCMVGNVFPLLALLEESEINPVNQQSRLKIIESAARYMIDNLLTNFKDKSFFRYRYETPIDEINHNVNALGVSVLSRIYKLTNKEEYKEIAIRCTKTLLEYQNPNGSWYYTDIIQKKTLSKQIDYHQGFIIDSLFDFIENIKPLNSKYSEALVRAADFYKNEQFLPNGQSKWRWPQKYPIDIHNQAQGILTFNKLSPYNSEYYEFSKIVANWTILNMQDSRGYFYTQKGLLIDNKIPYMRWGQSWILLALSTIQH